MGDIQLRGPAFDYSYTLVQINEDGQPHYTSLLPGQFGKARRLLSAELYAQVAAMWTPEAVAAYREELARSAEEA